MATEERIRSLVGDRVTIPGTVRAIPRGVYMVYVLTFDDTPIVVGHGKYNRAKVIFDDKDTITFDHIKAIFVRAYHLFGECDFNRYMIVCDGKDEAKQIESLLHDEIGGNNRELTCEIQRSLFEGIADDTIPYMLLQMALCSSYSGLSDLKMWRKKGIITDLHWRTLGDRLQLVDPIR